MENLPGFRQPPKQHPLPKPRKPIVTAQPQTYLHIQIGADLIANVIRPTLGPRPRLVAIERLKRTDPPEFLDDGATIARRIIEIQPRGNDVGAMLIRHALWRMHTQAGDGAATMAVMYQSILREGICCVTRGCNAMLLRTGLEKGLAAVLTHLRQSAMPLIGKQHITKMAEGLCQGDYEMAALLGEIFDIVGSDGLIVVEGSDGRGLEREYLEGTYWKLSGWFSRLFVNDVAQKRAMLEEAALLISDLDVQEPQQLIPVLEKCVKAGVKKLVIIARNVSNRVIGLLVSNNHAKTIQALAVRTPRIGEMERVAAMEDIAALTGGRIFYSAAHSSFEDFRPEDLGRARRVWATESLFGIYGGKGDPRQIRKHIARIRARLIDADDERDKADLQDRLGRLHGGTVILRVGGVHTVEREARKGMAERAVKILRNAIAGGVVPGGGVALLNTQSALMGLPASNEEEAFAYKILARALEEPMRAIAANAGYAPEEIVAKAKSLPSGWGFNACSGHIVDMKQAGILDSVHTLQKALEIAVGGASIALTTDVIVHHRMPVESLEP
ncbi:MAG: chaperonin GroEL [Anaerolineae bacterium]|nr:chaperonin GroEL [Candidatus Roseilinea sp.]MDW8449907.1 chaperonin GroEL [Anaerolineae bacterium]